MKLAFIGIGTMGRHMAANLLRAGYQVTVYNRDRSKAEALGPAVSVANSPGEAAASADVVITMLSDDRAVLDVYSSPSGIIQALKAGVGARIAIDCSTISPETSMQLSASLAEAGVDMLDAPVTGSEPQAKDKLLTFIVGGKREVFERSQPLFEAMGKKSVYMGESGAGAKTKLANNALVAINLAALSESMTLIRKSGLDPALFLEVLGGGGGRSGMAEMKGPKILDRDFSPQFMTQLMFKDLKLAGTFAEALQMPTPMLSGVKQLFQIACNSGYGAEDMSAIVKCYEDWVQLPYFSKPLD